MDTFLRYLAQTPCVTRRELCAQLSVTPDALATQLDALRAQGYRLDETAETGLTLAPVADSLLPGYLWQALTTVGFGRGEVFYAPQMDSTNLVLKREAAARPLPEGSLAVCDRQTAGRGRMQRVWEDPTPGASLTCSLLLRPKMPPDRLALITLATAVAVAETIATFGPEPGIKWPNDVVLGERKCTGILCERVDDPAGEPCIVVGTGINVNQTEFPEALRDRATSMRMAGVRDIDRRTLLCRYLAQLERAMDALTRAGLAGILPAYAARSVTLGRRVRVVGAAESFTGVAEKLDDTGALCVLDEAGVLRRVLSGDVSVRGVMGYV